MGRWAKSQRKMWAIVLRADEKRVSALASERRLFVLPTGADGVRKWRIYDRKTGRAVANYWPKQSRLVYLIGPCQAERVTEANRVRVMELVRERITRYF